MTRAAFCLGLMMTAALTAGCASVVVEDQRQAAVGQKAADVFNARALALLDQRDELFMQQIQLDKRCDEHLKEVWAYYNLEAFSYKDPVLRPTERLAYAAAYDSLATLSKDRVERCRDLSGALGNSITYVSNRRDNVLSEADAFDRMRWALP